MTKILLGGKMKTINIDKSMKARLDMLPGMIEKCKEHFIPQVATLIAWPEATECFNIEFIEAMVQVSGLRFELQIDIDGLTHDELMMALGALECLTHWEPGEDGYQPGFSMNGYTFTIGDGDDAGAIYMRNGKLCVWVRCWEE